ncbi:type VII secretion integral membrane protein EccD [Kitasatospora sp. NPDC006697]|uniref:type VII secretion integral membrane protein EccD n=1 Tax=Kitasatospora sp. NPDC006697 TaxID=3364020 RepID=UPI0036CBB28C
MNNSAVAGLCRLRFHTPGAAFELAVPADVPLADLLPAVLGHAPGDLAEQGLDHGGWVLQRLGGEPLDEEQTADGLELRDGDTLYLRPRRAALPPVHFDDLVDGVASGVRERGDGWRPELTHHVAVAAAVLALAGGLALLALPGPAGPRAIGAAATAVLLLLGAASAARAMADTGAGIALGSAAVPFLGLAALLVPGGPGGHELLGARVLAAGSAAAGAGVLAVAAVGAGAPVFLGLVLVALLVAVAGGLLIGGLAVDQVAAVLSVLAVLAGAFVPSTAFRLSGLRLPALPRNAEELQEGIEPFPAEGVLARSLIADDYLMGLYSAVGAVTAACLVLLATGRGWGGPGQAGALSLLLLLHSRAIGSIRQRLVLLLPGLGGAALLVARVTPGHPPQARLLVLGGLLVAVLALLVAAWTVPGRRLLPYWGRLADLLHTLSAVALVPLALLVCGVYHAMRAMNG